MEAVAKELHRPARRNYQRRKVTLKGLKDLFQADLVEMIPYSKENNGYKYILTMINCLSKLAFAVPLKTKTGVEVAKALTPILAKNKMKHFQTDQGKEWFNTTVRKLLQGYGINHYATYSELKASIVERLNRTLKERMWRKFTARGSYEWLTLLPVIVREYNNTVHRTTGMKPKDVRQKHVKEILVRIAGKKQQQKQKKKKVQRPKFKVGDSVRISKNKRVFTKGYLPNWSPEVFTIYAVKPTKPVTYVLQDSRGEILKGGFYEQELLKSKTGDIHLVEKVLKRRGNKVLVRWQGYDSSHDSWIDKKNVVL